ncbi:MAG: MBL fold metallo-hydrolase [Eubacteriales bacterium]
MRLCSIASGSSGNCIYIGAKDTHILVDAGISGKRTRLGLQELGVDITDIDGIMVTHEHSDHIGGLGVLARKYKLPIYATEKTKAAILCAKSVGEIEPELFRVIHSDESFVVKDMTLNPVKISHDAVDPVAFRVMSDNKKIGIATDLGNYNDYIVESFQGMDCLFLEANHDVNMLQVGPYSYALKQRVLGNKGHLSNVMAGKLLDRLLHDKMKGVILGHLSHENNMPELAYETVRLELTTGNGGYKNGDFPIWVANRHELSKVIDV